MHHPIAFSSQMLFIISVLFYTKLFQYNECLICIVDTDGLVLQQQGISIHNANYAPMSFVVVKGWNNHFLENHHGIEEIIFFNLFYLCLFLFTYTYKTTQCFPITFSPK